MQGFRAWWGLLAMVCAVAGGPFFHIHLGDADHHDVVIHSHLPEILEAAATETAFDHAPDRKDGVPIEFLIANGRPQTFVGTVMEVQPKIVAKPVVQVGFVSIESVRTHDPPATFALTPRSPPA